MKFNLEPGMIATIVAMVIFYLRLAMLRGKKRRLQKEEALAVKKAGKRAKAKIEDPNKPNYEISSWVLVVISVVLMLVGLAARQNASFPALMQEYWWVGTTLGVLLFAFCFK
ncbi:MAG: hypothetical protein ABFD29_04290 [Anaerolineaceae bacterium]